MHGQSKRNVDVRHASCVQVVRGGLTNDTYLCSTGWVTWEACVKLFLGRFGALYPYSPAFFLRFFSFLRFLSCCFQANESTCHDSPPCHHVHRIAANWFERVGRTRNPRYEHRNWSILAVRLAFISWLWKVAHLLAFVQRKLYRTTVLSASAILTGYCAYDRRYLRCLSSVKVRSILITFLLFRGKQRDIAKKVEIESKTSDDTYNC